MPKTPWLEKIKPLATPPPLRTLLRSTAYKLSPPRALPFEPAVTRRQERVAAAEQLEPRRICPILWEERPGQLPTIVIGGFVPEPQDATYLQRPLFLAHGSAFYLQFNRRGFSEAMFQAQLEDLVEELSRHHRTPPVLFSISYGSGLVLNWLRQCRERRTSPALAGLVFISPVACVADLIDPGAPKPTTLLGRVVKGYLDRKPGEAEDNAWADKARGVMHKMFDSGAQNRTALRKVLTRPEVTALRDRVATSLRETDFHGGGERIRCIEGMVPLPVLPEQLLPLAPCPTLVLFAEKESSILTETSPTRTALERGVRRYFPEGEHHLVRNPRGTPVQHASLIFHCFNFEPVLRRFYRRQKHRLPGPRRWQHALARMLRPAHTAGSRRARAAALASSRLPDDPTHSGRAA